VWEEVRLMEREKEEEAENKQCEVKGTGHSQFSRA
jgi:hypothetical protein